MRIYFILNYSNYATMRFEPESLHGANNGLNIARAKMEEVKKEFPWISYGDLWTLGGVCAIQVSILSFLPFSHEVKIVRAHALLPREFLAAAMHVS